MIEVKINGHYGANTFGFDGHAIELRGQVGSAAIDAYVKFHDDWQAFTVWTDPTIAGYTAERLSLYLAKQIAAPWVLEDLAGAIERGDVLQPLSDAFAFQVQTAGYTSSGNWRGIVAVFNAIGSYEAIFAVDSQSSEHVRNALRVRGVIEVPRVKIDDRELKAMAKRRGDVWKSAEVAR